MTACLLPHPKPLTQLHPRAAPLTAPPADPHTVPPARSPSQPPLTPHTCSPNRCNSQPRSPPHPCPTRSPARSPARSPIRSQPRLPPHPKSAHPLMLAAPPAVPHAAPPPRAAAPKQTLAAPPVGPHAAPAARNPACCPTRIPANSSACRPIPSPTLTRLCLPPHLQSRMQPHPRAQELRSKRLLPHLQAHMQPQPPAAPLAGPRAFPHTAPLAAASHVASYGYVLWAWAGRGVRTRPGNSALKKAKKKGCSGNMKQIRIPKNPNAPSVGPSCEGTADRPLSIKAERQWRLVVVYGALCVGVE